MSKRLAFVLGSRPFMLLRAFVSLRRLFGCGYAALGNLSSLRFIYTFSLSMR
jgi:hypothetical protein